jgi:hypothetical protein
MIKDFFKERKDFSMMSIMNYMNSNKCLTVRTTKEAYIIDECNVKTEDDGKTLTLKDCLIAGQVRLISIAKINLEYVVSIEN